MLIYSCSAGALSVASIVHFCFSISMFDTNQLSVFTFYSRENSIGQAATADCTPNLFAKESHIFTYQLYTWTPSRNGFSKLMQPLPETPPQSWNRTCSICSKEKGTTKLSLRCGLWARTACTQSGIFHGRNGFRNMSQVFRLLKQTLILKNHWT